MGWGFLEPPHKMQPEVIQQVLSHRSSRYKVQSSIKYVPMQLWASKKAGNHTIA